MGKDDRGKTNEQLIGELEALRAEVDSLRDRVNLLRAAVEDVTDTVFAKDLQGRYLMINTAGADRIGRTVEEVIGKDDAELFAAETARRFREGDRQVIAAGATRRYEESATVAGVQRSYLKTKGPYRDDQGRVIGVVGIAQDITESKTLEAERDWLQARIRLQIDRLPLAYIRVDTAHRVLEWNPAAEKMFGYTKEEASGRSGLDLIVPPPVRRELEDVIRRLWAGDRNAHSVNENRTKDGRIITCEWFNTPVIDADGRFAGVISLAQDITAQKRATEALEESRRRYQAIFENSLEAILLIDNSGRFVDGNPAACQLLGYSREELLQLTVSEVTPIERRDRITGLLSGFLVSGTLSGEYTFVCKGGATAEVEYRAVANILPGLHLGVHRDITARKRDDETLRSSTKRLKLLSQRVVDVQEEERRRLARELHDEIGQDLTVIGTCLQTLKRSSSAAALPQLEECIGMISHTLEQVHRLALDLRPSMLDDLGLAAALRWLADRQAGRAGLKVHFAIPAAAIGVSADAATACFRIGQEALTNLLRHARAENVWIELLERDHEVHLTIQDDGAGFDPAEARHRATTGASLGLLGIQERVDLLGGQLTIDSAPGRGTQIHVRLPAAAAPANQDSADEDRSR